MKYDSDCIFYGHNHIDISNIDIFVINYQILAQNLY